MKTLSPSKTTSHSYRLQSKAHAQGGLPSVLLLAALAVSAAACGAEPESVSTQGHDIAQSDENAPLLACEALAKEYRKECSPVTSRALSSEEALSCAADLSAAEDSLQPEACCAALGERPIIGNRHVRMCRQAYPEPGFSLKGRECADEFGTEWGTGDLQGTMVRDCVLRLRKGGRDILVRENHAFLPAGSKRADAPNAFASDEEALAATAREETYVAGLLMYNEAKAASFSFLPSRMREATSAEIKEMRKNFPESFAAVSEFDEVLVVTEPWAYIAFRATAPFLPGGAIPGGFF